MIRENPKTGVLEESDMLGLSYSPVTNDVGRMTRTNPDTGVKEESDMLNLGWSPIINDAGDMTRRDPETGELQQSGILNLWWDPASSDSGVSDHPSASNLAPSSASSSSGSGSENSSSSGGGSFGVLTSSGTALNVLESPARGVAKGLGSPTSGSTGGTLISNLGAVAGVLVAVAAVAVVGGLLEAVFKDKNLIARLPPVDPPPSRVPARILLFIASFLAVTFFLSGIGMIGDFPKFARFLGICIGGIAIFFCFHGWRRLFEDEKREEANYLIAVKKREHENKVIDERNKAYLKEKAAGKK